MYSPGISLEITEKIKKKLSVIRKRFEMGTFPEEVEGVTAYSSLLERTAIFNLYTHSFAVTHKVVLHM
jgi:hypothetical protein